LALSEDTELEFGAFLGKENGRKSIEKQAGILAFSGLIGNQETSENSNKINGFVLALPTF
jgi:hypothetical protein